MKLFVPVHLPSLVAYWALFLWHWFKLFVTHAYVSIIGMAIMATWLDYAMSGYSSEVMVETSLN